MPDTFVQKIITGVVIGLVVGILMLVILLPMSYSDVQYYEYGFLKRKSSGHVVTTKVYTSGRYFLGPDHTFKIFRADAHNITFKRIAVFTADKLELFLTVKLQYFLRKDDLPLLHAAYDIYYEPILRTNAQDSLKGAATVFSTREFIRERSLVEQALFKAVRERLGGKCCQPNCQATGRCHAGCVKYTRCKTGEKGLFADVRYFQLHEVRIPSDVEDRFQRALILQEETEREFFTQEALVVEKETDAEVKAIHNKANEIEANSVAEADLIKSMAGANVTIIMERARMDGLRLLYSSLGITDQHQKSSFNYLRSLRHHSQAHFTVDFQQIIVGADWPGKK